MALQTSGAISLNDIHVEAGGTSGTQAALNDVDIRDLIGKASGAQSSFSEFYGASALAGVPSTKTEYTTYADGSTFPSGAESTAPINNFLYDYTNNILYFTKLVSSVDTIYYSSNDGSTWTSNAQSGSNTIFGDRTTSSYQEQRFNHAAWPHGSKGLITGTFSGAKTTTNHYVYFQQDGSDFNIKPSSTSFGSTVRNNVSIDHGSSAVAWGNPGQDQIWKWSGSTSTPATVVTWSLNSVWYSLMPIYGKNTNLIVPYADDSSTHTFSYRYSTNSGTNWSSVDLLTGKTNQPRQIWADVDKNDTDQYYMMVYDGDTSKYILYKVDTSSIGSATTVSSDVATDTGITHPTGFSVSDNNVFAVVGNSHVNLSTSYTVTTKAAFREGWGTSGWTVFTHTNNPTGTNGHYFKQRPVPNNSGTWWVASGNYWVKYTQ